MNITSEIINWYNKNKRDLPWRKTNDPYKIWVSEIILQQTRINQGYQYYLNFINSFPDLFYLANSDEINVLKIWQGLGYYSRARNMHFTSKIIVNKFNGKFPDNYKDLISLKGIGEYSAGAILSFAFKKAYPAIDGNVLRLISRIYKIKESINKPETKKIIKNIILELMDNKQPDIFNQSLIELGALICKPQNPLCNLCQISQNCFSFIENLQHAYPVKTKKIKIKERFFNYFLIKYVSNNNLYIYLKKREDNDIWKNLYDLPLIETKKNHIQSNQINFYIKKTFKIESFILNKINSSISHKLTHQKINTIFIEITVENKVILNNAFLIKYEDLKNFPLPKLIKNFFD